MSFPTGAAYPESSQATTALVLSILGIVCCGPLAIVGWVIANNELAGISAGRRNPSNEGSAKAARVVGIIGTILWGIGIIAAAALSIGGAFEFPFNT